MCKTLLKKVSVNIQEDFQNYEFKNLHAYSEEPIKVAYSFIDDLLLFLDKPVLWGSQVICQKPNIIHDWHVDAESNLAPILNLWVSIEGLSPEANIAYCENSRFNNEFFYQQKKPVTDDYLGGLFKLSYPNIKDNEAFIFWGDIWHKTFNSSNKTRKSLLLQFTELGNTIKIPENYRPPIKWKPIVTKHVIL